MPINFVVCTGHAAAAQESLGCLLLSSTQNPVDVRMRLHTQILPGSPQPKQLSVPVRCRCSPSAGARARPSSWCPGHAAWQRPQCGPSSVLRRVLLSKLCSTSLLPRGCMSACIRGMQLCYSHARPCMSPRPGLQHLAMSISAVSLLTDSPVQAHRKRAMRYAPCARSECQSCVLLIR